MISVTYLDGTTSTSTALTPDQIQQVFQIATCQMLGITAFSVSMGLVLNSNIATPSSMNNLTAGQVLTDSSIPQGTTIVTVNTSTITMSAVATATATDSVVVSDPTAFSKVRVDWNTQGQPGWDIASDTAFLRCETQDTEFSRLRDGVGTSVGNVYTDTDTFTRTWHTFWTFYGPNSSSNAKLVASALSTLQFVSDLLALSNIYINPSIEEPHRFRENFQGEWWERVDLVAEFNEQVTETITVGTVESVGVTLYNDSGQLETLTIKA